VAARSRWEPASGRCISSACRPSATRRNLAVGAALLGTGICAMHYMGMHYTGMAAAQFAPNSICLAADATGGLDNAMLALIVGTIAIGLLVFTIVVSAYDAQ
jgi:diguanylate cyclase